MDRRAYQIAWKRAHPERVRAYLVKSNNKLAKARRVRRVTRARKLAVRADRKAWLVCVVCKAPAADGRFTCSACSADQRVLLRNLKARRKAEGRCWGCGRPAAPFVNCDRCRARARDRTQRLAKQGRCHCGFPARTGKRTCQFCVDYKKGYRERNRPDDSEHCVQEVTGRLHPQKNDPRDIEPEKNGELRCVRVHRPLVGSSSARRSRGDVGPG